MTPLDRLRVIYELDDARFTAGINRMRGASDRFAREAVGFGNRAEGAFGGVSRSAIAAAASVAGLGVAINKMRSATDAFKVIENQLRSIGQSSDDATDKLLSSAIRSRASIEELSTGVARIQKATGDGYEVTLRRVETLNKLLSVGGATAQEVSSVMVQISQAFTSGELMGEELRALREAAPVALLDAIAEAAGGTRAELKKFGEEGKLTNEVVTRALDNMKEAADRQFGETTQTIGQAMTNINNALIVFVGRVDEGTGASETLVSALSNLSEWLVDNADEAVQLGQSLGAMFDVAQDRVGEFLSLIDTVADSVSEAFGTDQLDDFADGVDRVIGFIADLNGAIEGAAAVSREAFLGLADNIAEGLASAINAVIGAVQGMVNSVLAGVRTAAGAIDTVTAGAASIYGGEGTNIAGGIQDVDLGSVTLGPRSSSGKPLAQVYQEAREGGAARVIDALDRQNEAYGGALAGRQIASRTPLQYGLPPVEAAPADTDAGGGGGGSGGSSGGSKGGGKGRTAKAESPFFGDIEKDLLNLERQISLVGKSNEEVATAKARWELLDEAKKRGIPVNEELSAQIDAQAEQFGRLTGELERAEKSQQQFEQAVDGIADAMAGALVAGESLRDGLAQVLKGIASDILTSGIRSALQGQFGGGGVGLLNIIGGFFGAGPTVAGNDGLSNTLRGISGFRAGGGSVSAGRAYVVGEDEPELFVPNVSGTILNGAQVARAGMGGGGGRAEVVIHAPAGFTAEQVAQAEGISVRVVSAASPQIVGSSVSASRRSMGKSKAGWGI